MTYLVDTNILIYYFNGSLSSTAEKNISKILKNSFIISVISKMEFLGFDKFKIKEKLKAAQFLSYANVIPLKDDIVDYVIQIRQNKKIKLPDAIIAATAILENLILVTRNVEDF